MTAPRVARGRRAQAGEQCREFCDALGLLSHGRRGVIPIPAHPHPERQPKRGTRQASGPTTTKWVTAACSDHPLIQLNSAAW